jgi:two-component system, chemotaxis family, sensor kinase CheA
MPELDADMLELFRAETAERLDRIEHTLLDLEAGRAADDAIDVLFRDAHSIKGNAAMAGYDAATAVAHAMEDALERPRATGAFPSDLAASLLRSTDALRRALADEPTAGPEPGPLRSVRVDAAKVDHLLDSVGEAALNQRRLRHALGDAARDEAVEEELDQGQRLLGDLQDAVVDMRTLPLATITAPFPRTVRDAAAAEGKQCALHVSGDETQLDRAILDHLGETLVHLLRNAVSHGIETPVRRRAAGKDPTGRIELRAEQRGGQVAISVSDDGAGVPEEVLARAQDAGSLAEVLAAPGFSTAEAVGELSGRGVGLDEVKARVEAQSGSLAVTSEPGAGTTVTLRLPLTLALLQLLLVERAGLPFGIPVASIVELVRVEDVTSVAGRRALVVRGEPLPLVELGPLLGEPDGPPARGAPAAVIEAAGARVAVTGDRLLGEQEVVVKALGPLLAGLKGYLGGAIMGDGRIALIADPAFFVRTVAAAPPRAAVLPPAPAAPAVREVLVVDDQLTVRELQRSILEAAGLRVYAAGDGQEALEVLAREDGIELVVTDLQMPRLDGFGLLAHLRADPERAHLPVVVVTSKGSEEDRRRGAEAGADAYVVKDEFDQRKLLDTVRRLLGA